MGEIEISAICIEIIHVIRDMYKNCEKLYIYNLKVVEHSEKVAQISVCPSLHFVPDS